MSCRYIINYRKCLRTILKNEIIRREENVRFSSKDYPTMHELKTKHSKILGVDPGYKTEPLDRSHLLKYTPKFEDLPPRNIKDSFLQAIIPLSKSVALQQSYITFLGSVRVGRLLEDMDIFAVHVGIKHIYSPTLPADVAFPFMLVTARCDHIVITSFVRKPNEDIKLSGFVSWVGKSSMEVVVLLEQQYQGSWHKITRAIFLLAARNATGKEAVAVNPLQPLNEFEQKIREDGEDRKNKRVKIVRSSVSKVIPTTEEQQLIHDLHEKYMIEIRKGSIDKKKFPHGVAAMEKCRVSSIIYSQPENRNFYNVIFGGFTMRHASEIAWVLGYKLFKQRPSIKIISDVDFHSAIAVSALMLMRTRVVYTQENFAQVIVSVFALLPLENKETRSNTLHITLKMPLHVIQVYPKSYHEAMLYIDGRRHFERAQNQLKDSEADVVDVMDQYIAKLGKEKK